MNRSHFFLTLILGVISGFLGGALAMWMIVPLTVDAEAGVPNVIAAREFHVIDDSGTIRARLGWTRGENDPFGPGYERTYLEFLDEAFWNQDDETKKVRQINLEHTEGGWYFGPTRTLTFLASGAPVRSGGTVTMGDLGRKGFLTIKQIDEDSSATIEPSSLKILGEERGQAELRIEDGPPALKLFDQEERLRAAFGAAKLKPEQTGTTEIRSVSSLVLLDDDGKVVWSAP